MLGTPPDVVAAAGAAEQARVASVLNILPISRRGAGLALEAKLTVEPLSKPLDQLTVRTLAVGGRDDLYGTWRNAELITRAVPHGRFIGYPAGGHLLLGHAEEVLAAIAHFLGESGADASR